MRTILLLVVLLGFSGCKSAQIAVTHPTTGIQIVARFEAKDPAPAELVSFVQRLPN